MPTKHFPLFMMALLAGACETEYPSFWGNDGGDGAVDGTCNDPRFIAVDETASPVALEAPGRDATDCRRLVEEGRIRIRDFDGYFGDDSGDYALDGECDDPWFEGPGMAAILLGEDRGRDATDCRMLYDRGRIRLRN